MFHAEIRHRQIGDLTTKKEYFFRDPNTRSLMAYVEVSFPKNTPTVAHVQNLTSARAFSHFSPHMRGIYRDNGYKSEYPTPPGLGMKALDTVLTEIHETGERKIIVICVLEKNRRALTEILSEHYKSNQSEYIEKITGGGENSAATIFFH